MKKTMCFLLIVLGMFCHHPALADAPHRIAGIELGGNVEQLRDRLNMDSEITVRQMEYLAEVETKPLPGFKSGYITYGKCAPAGQIVKIKLKYAREDRKFFEELLMRFKSKFGESCEYKGDVFRAVMAWKWAFTDKDGNRISLILQHNSEDDEENTSGNSLKMTMTNAVETQRRCYEMKHPEEENSSGEGSNHDHHGRMDIDQFVPN